MDAYKPSSSQRGAQSSNHDMAKIFVGGLSWQTTEETLRYHFEQYGEVVSVEVMRDRNTGNPRGFAFCVFKDDATVELVMQNLPHEINHKIVDVKRAQARGAAPPSIHRNGQEEDGDSESGADVKASTGGNPGARKEMSPEELQNKVFVGGLPLHVDKEALQKFFTQFGGVSDAIVMIDAVHNRSRGFGFVTFENGTGGAQGALKAQPIYMDGKYVEIKLATPKGDQLGKKSFQNAGLRNYNAAAMSSSKGEFAGLAASFARGGWKAGYGSFAFGSCGWEVKGWEDLHAPTEISGFSFDLMKQQKQQPSGSSSRKRASASDHSRDSKRTRRHDY
mmetsp:Transcript_15283/g.22402  ORF Transcript_15283/g.22402 Transcript_15283/m.22402 type:complete len:334 (+) Transcript_15283:31-1032(+)